MNQRLGKSKKSQRERASYYFFGTRLRNRTDGKWLVVLDDVEDVQWLLEGEYGERRLDHLPLSSRDSMLVTTRESSAALKLVDPEDIFTVSTLSEQEALSFIKAKLPDRNNDDDIDFLARLARWSDRSPHTLSRLLGMIQERSATVNDLLERLSAVDEQDTPSIKRWPFIATDKVSHGDVASTRGPATEPGSMKTSSATVPYTDLSRTTKDSGYGSQEAARVIIEDNEEQDGASDARSIKTVSSFVDFGMEGRLRGINIFASDLVQSLSPEIPGVAEGRELVVTVVQLALRAYSYSLEQRTRPKKTSDERRAAHFIRQQSQ